VEESLLERLKGSHWRRQRLYTWNTNLCQVLSQYFSRLEEQCWGNRCINQLQTSNIPNKKAITVWREVNKKHNGPLRTASEPTNLEIIYLTFPLTHQNLSPSIWEKEWEKKYRNGKSIRAQSWFIIEKQWKFPLEMIRSSIMKRRKYYSRVYCHYWHSKL
jgi:hypothetical protein